jgi:hypothetical protein
LVRIRTNNTNTDRGSHFASPQGPASGSASVSASLLTRLLCTEAGNLSASNGVLMQ